MGEEYWSDYYNKYPSIFSFINIRKEKRGGFIFNPYLYTEKWLNEIEYQALEIMDGCRSVLEIIFFISEFYGINQKDAKKIVLNALQEISSYHAIIFSDKLKLWKELPTAKRLINITLKMPFLELGIWWVLRISQ